SMPFFKHPAAVCGLAALGVRLAAGLQSVAVNPLLRDLQLDSLYYVRWAGDIAAGDWTGRGGKAGGAPFVLNPLSASGLAPIVGAFADPVVPVLVFQSILAAATTALAVVAARRFFGTVAAWTAGAAVAFSAALAQLDMHVAVSGLAAFLTAGAVFASA